MTTQFQENCKFVYNFFQNHKDEVVVLDCRSYLPAKYVEEFTPMYFDIRWHKDHLFFQPIPLTWWDDRSYIEYQSFDCEE